MSFNYMTKLLEVQIKLDSVEKALIDLVERLDLVHDDKYYQSVWTLWHCHHGDYEGPSYERELIAAKEALSKLRAASPSIEEGNK